MNSELAVDEMMGIGAGAGTEEEGAPSAPMPIPIDVDNVDVAISSGPPNPPSTSSRSSPRVKIEEPVRTRLSLAGRIMDDTDVQDIETHSMAVPGAMQAGKSAAISNMSIDLNMVRQLFKPILMMNVRRRGGKHHGGSDVSSATGSVLGAMGSRVGQVKQENEDGSVGDITRNGMSNLEAHVRAEEERETERKVEMALTDEAILELAKQARWVQEQVGQKTRRSASGNGRTQLAPAADIQKYPVPIPDRITQRDRRESFVDSDLELEVLTSSGGGISDRRVEQERRLSETNLHDGDARNGAAMEDWDGKRAMGSNKKAVRGGGENGRDDEATRHPSDDHLSLSKTKDLPISPLSRFPRTNGSHLPNDRQSHRPRRHSTSPPPRGDRIELGPIENGKRRRDRDMEEYDYHEHEGRKRRRYSPRARSHDRRPGHRHALRDRIGSPTLSDDYDQRDHGIPDRGRSDYKSERGADGLYRHKQWVRDPIAPNFLDSSASPNRQTNYTTGHPEDNDEPASVLNMVNDLVTRIRPRTDVQSHIEKDLYTPQEHPSDRGSPLPPGLHATKSPPKAPKAHQDVKIAAADRFLASMQLDLGPSVSFLSPKPASSSTIIPAPAPITLPSSASGPARALSEAVNNANAPGPSVVDSPRDSHAQTKHIYMSPPAIHDARNGNGHSKQTSTARTSTSHPHRAFRQLSSAASTNYSTDERIENELDASMFKRGNSGATEAWKRPHTPPRDGPFAPRVSSEPHPASSSPARSLGSIALANRGTDPDALISIPPKDKTLANASVVSPSTAIGSLSKAVALGTAQHGESRSARPRRSEHDRDIQDRAAYSQNILDRERLERHKNMYERGRERRDPDRDRERERGTDHHGIWSREHNDELTATASRDKDTAVSSDSVAQEYIKARKEHAKSRLHSSSPHPSSSKPSQPETVMGRPIPLPQNHPAYFAPVPPPQPAVVTPPVPAPPSQPLTTVPGVWLLKPGSEHPDSSSHCFEVDPDNAVAVRRWSDRHTSYE